MYIDILKMIETSFKNWYIQQIHLCKIGEGRGSNSQYLK